MSDNKNPPSGDASTVASSSFMYDDNSSRSQLTAKEKPPNNTERALSDREREEATTDAAQQAFFQTMAAAGIDDLGYSSQDGKRRRFTTTSMIRQPQCPEPRRQTSAPLGRIAQREALASGRRGSTQETVQPTTDSAKGSIENPQPTVTGQEPQKGSCQPPPLASYAKLESKASAPPPQQPPTGNPLLSMKLATANVTNSQEFFPETSLQRCANTLGTRHSNNTPGAYSQSPGQGSIRLEPIDFEHSAVSSLEKLSDASSSATEEDYPSPLPTDLETATVVPTIYNNTDPDDKTDTDNAHTRDYEVTTGNLIEAHAVDDIVEVDAKPIEWWTPRKLTALILGSLLIVAIIVGVATGLALRYGGEPATVVPTLSPTVSPNVRYESIAEIVALPWEPQQEDSVLIIVGGEDIGSPEDNSTKTPQEQALEWIAWEDSLQVSLDDPDHLRQRYSLAVLYFSTGGEHNWTEHYEFLRPSHECTWSGALQCNRDTVTGIDLTKNNLVGRLPPEIGMLADLHTLALNDNVLTGRLPSVLPSKLQRLDLWSNKLEGSMNGSALGDLTELESFRVGNNFLTGTVPSEVGALTKLTRLSLESNRLTGAIPEKIWNLSMMQDFRIGQQILTGTVPPSIGAWNNCSVFHVNKLNGITGSIPSEIGLLTMLTSLKFSQNHMRGTLPSELGNLLEMRLMAISRNGISGIAPTELGRLSNIEELFLQNTWLEGNMDYICGAKERGDLPHLHTFNVDMEEVNCTCCTCCKY
ncbi:Leucine Rich Repeat [Seminavis robusta]|uniref:Leucine Rich Repeat n=1 Tax=Seminavis robusta TaxID=568900 RepID=A0A9N8DYX4_9STRA|nr:Leucine Rich Repeat [Seminavis robusta]|eukprot:Sro486_g152710.1 Leucine Rich Repeat (755) ;mRNA; f:57940-60204